MKRKGECPVNILTCKIQNTMFFNIRSEREITPVASKRMKFFFFYFVLDSNGPCTKRSCNHHSLCVESGDLAFCECPECTLVNI